MTAEVRAEDVLRDLEWSGYSQGEFGLCPVCFGDPDMGHASDCRLSAALSLNQKEDGDGR